MARLAPLLVSSFLLFPMIALAGCAYLGMEFTIPHPEPGFVWDYGTHQVEHLGPGQILDRTARPVDVEVVQVRWPYPPFQDFPGGISTALVYVTPDMKELVAARHLCTSDAPACLGWMEFMSWSLVPTPWWFGASDLWGVTLRFDRHGSLRGVDDPTLLEAWEFRAEGANVQAVPREHPLLHRWMPGAPTLVRANLTFAPGAAAPLSIAASPVPAEVDVPALHLERSEVRALSGMVLPPRTDRPHLTLPQAESRPNAIPFERDPSYYPFPFTEMWAALDEELGGIPPDAAVRHAGQAGRGGVYVEHGLPLPDWLDPGRIDLREHWRWTVSLAEPGKDPVGYYVRKEDDLVDGTSISVTPWNTGPSDGFDEDRFPGTLVALDDVHAFAEATFPSTPAYGVRVASPVHWGGGMNEHIIHSVALVPVDWNESHQGFLHSLALEATRGELLSVAHTPDVLDQMFVLSDPRQ